MIVVAGPRQCSPRAFRRRYFVVTQCPLSAPKFDGRSGASSLMIGPILPLARPLTPAPRARAGAVPLQLANRSTWCTMDERRWNKGST